jgi:hypothetical protein
VPLLRFKVGTPSSKYDLMTTGIYMCNILGKRIMKIMIFQLIASLLILSGCATQKISTRDYTPPEETKFVSEKFINSPQSSVWDRLVKNMATSFFVINNIDKESRIINLSYSSDKPQDYLTCGKTRRTYSDEKSTQVFEYGVTDNYATYATTGDKQLPAGIIEYALVNRSVKMEGRANVYVAPEGVGTRITVNTKSVANINVQGILYRKNFLGESLGNFPINSSSTLTAVTKGAYNNSTSDPLIRTITCYSTGALEREILDLAN